MNENTVVFYGSSKDLEDLEKFMIEEGFLKYECTAIEAGNNVAWVVKFLEYVIVSALVPCVIKYLDVRGKRMVSRTNDKIVITGHSAKDAAMLLQSEHKFQLEDSKHESKK